MTNFQVWLWASKTSSKGMLFCDTSIVFAFKDCYEVFIVLSLHEVKMTIFNQRPSIFSNNYRNFYSLVTSELKKFDLILELGCCMLHVAQLATVTFQHELVKPKCVEKS